MATAESVMAARELGEEHPDEQTTKIVTIKIDSTSLVSPLYIVKNSVEPFVAEGNTYLSYPFSEELPSIKQGVRPEMSIIFVQVSTEQEEAIIEVSSALPHPTVLRSTWEVTTGGVITKTSEFLYPMPIRKVDLGSNGMITATCSEEDYDDTVMNPIVYNTTDHPSLKGFTG